MSEYREWGLEAAVAEANRQLGRDVAGDGTILVDSGVLDLKAILTAARRSEEPDPESEREIEVVKVYIRDYLDEDAADAMFTRITEAARANGENVITSMSTQVVSMDWPIFDSWMGRER